MNDIKSNFYNEIIYIFLISLFIYGCLYYFAPIYLSPNGILYDFSYFILTFSPVVLLHFVNGMFQTYKRENTNWVAYWKDRGYTVPKHDEAYEDRFDEFFRKYYSSEKICNRLSDA